MTLLRNKRTPKTRTRVYRQYVFVGRSPRGDRHELVASNLHEIECQAAMLKLSGILTWHNVRVVQRGSFKEGVFIA